MRCEIPRTWKKKKKQQYPTELSTQLKQLKYKISVAGKKKVSSHPLRDSMCCHGHDRLHRSCNGMCAEFSPGFLIQSKHLLSSQIQPLFLAIMGPISSNLPLSLCNALYTIRLYCTNNNLLNQLWNGYDTATVIYL